MQFFRSLVANSVVGYIVGIGDRHLDNILLDYRTLSLVSIDFGYSLGAAVRLAIPELVPFRFTPQFQELLLPLDTTKVRTIVIVYVGYCCFIELVHQPLNPIPIRRLFIP